MLRMGCIYQAGYECIYSKTVYKEKKCATHENTVRLEEYLDPTRVHA